MYKASIKRKNDEKESNEIINPSKRLKIVDIIRKEIVKEENNCTNSNLGMVKRRNKLLTSMHLKKRYKYYCKKHDTTYLIESERQKAKNISKENRYKFIQRFRTHNLTNSHNISIDYKSPTNKCIEILKNNQSKFNSNEYMEKLFVKPKSSKFTEALNHNLSNNNIIFDNEGDSDFADDYDETWLKKQKIIKCLIVRKTSESNKIIFSEDEDFSESDFDDGNSDCDCYYHENLKNNYHNYEYESSSDDD